MGLGGLVLDFPSLLYKGLRILMFQLSGVYCRTIKTTYSLHCGSFFWSAEIYTIES